MTTVPDILSRILESTPFAHISDPTELVDTIVRLRIRTGGDDYDIVGTTVITARLRVGGWKEAEWLELTFPQQEITQNAWDNPRWNALALVRVTKYAGEGWRAHVRRTGLTRFFVGERRAQCDVRPKSTQRSSLQAA